MKKKKKQKKNKKKKKERILKILCTLYTYKINTHMKTFKNY